MNLLTTPQPPFFSSSLLPSLHHVSLVCFFYTRLFHSVPWCMTQLCKGTTVLSEFQWKNRICDLLNSSSSTVLIISHQKWCLTKRSQLKIHLRALNCISWLLLADGVSQDFFLDLGSSSLVKRYQFKVFLLDFPGDLNCITWSSTIKFSWMPLRTSFLTY